MWRGKKCPATVFLGVAGVIARGMGLAEVSIAEMRGGQLGEFS